MKTHAQLEKEKQIYPLIMSKVRDVLHKAGLPFIEEKPENSQFTWISFGTKHQIQLQAECPRPYQGRLDGGKQRWTLDIKEVSTYSRTAQVPVKVIEFDYGFAISFNEGALNKHILAKMAIVDLYEDQQIKRTIERKAEEKMADELAQELAGKTISKRVKWAIFVDEGGTWKVEMKVGWATKAEVLRLLTAVDA